MNKILTFCFFLYFTCHFDNVHSSAEVMKQMSAGFGKAIDQCKTELNLQDNIMLDLSNYWKEDYALLNREFGCAIICLSKKLNLIDEEGKLHHGNAAEFAKQHGADDEMAKKLVEIIHGCDDTNIEDGCTRVLEMAKCFRTKIHELKWAPNMDVAIEEVLAEV